MNIPKIAFGAPAVEEAPPTVDFQRAQARRRELQAIPTIPLPDRETLLANGIFGLEPMDIRARSFLLLRTQLLGRFHAPGGRVLAITSTQPGDGKTYVTANVAAALSTIHPTILVDLDLRRPTLSSRFGVEVTCGIDDFLAGDAEWGDVGVQLGSGALTLYGVREPRRDSARLLASDRLRLMLSHFRARADAAICIVDTPPVLVVDDMMLIVRNVDGALIILEEGRTRTKDVAEALRILGPTPIVGSVLNKSLTAEPISRGYDYYNYAS